MKSVPPLEPLAASPKPPVIRRSADVSRLWWFFGAVAVALIVLAGPMTQWATYTSSSDIHSYVLLVPAVCAYLLFIRRGRLSTHYESDPVPGIVFLIAALAALACRWRFQSALDENDQVTLGAAAFSCLVLALAFFTLGWQWFRAAAFPLCFLFLMIPLPSEAVDALERASQYASAEVAHWLFSLTGLPIMRDGLNFHLPGFSVRVAQECSGIHSSLVLIVTSILAANLFLQTTWRRIGLVVAVIPLGLLRNGFRVVVISLLCVYIGPHMIDSPIHHKGGPIFFALSLIPLFGLLWLLRRSELRGGGATAGSPLS